MNKPAIPSRSLLEGKPYRSADKTDIRELFRKVMQEQDGPDYSMAQDNERQRYEEEAGSADR